MEELFGEPLRALDLCAGRGASCGRMLTLLGVEVIKVEPPGGDAQRAARAGSGSDVDLDWVALNTGKKSVTVNLISPTGRELFLRLADTAAFVIESSEPGYLDELGLGYEVLAARNPRAILTSITPFGADGPYAHHAASDVTLLAMGGLMYQNGESDRAPLRFSVDQTEPLAGAQAAAATLIAHEARSQTGLGQHIDVSMQEAVLAADFMQQQFWDILRENPRRMGAFGVRNGVRMRMIYPVADGYVSWRLMFGAHGYMTKAVTDWMLEEGEAADLDSVDWDALDIRDLSQARVDEFELAIGNFFRSRGRSMLYDEAIKRGIVLFPVSTAGDLLADGQLRFREFWQTVDQPLLGRQVPVPARPYLTGARRAEPAQRPAPGPGEHNAEIFAALGLTSEALRALQSDGVL